jgi:hypothetical protein
MPQILVSPGEFHLDQSSTTGHRLLRVQSETKTILSRRIQVRDPKAVYSEDEDSEGVPQ